MADQDQTVWEVEHPLLSLPRLFSKLVEEHNGRCAMVSLHGPDGSPWNTLLLAFSPPPDLEYMLRVGEWMASQGRMKSHPPEGPSPKIVAHFSYPPEATLEVFAYEPSWSSTARIMLSGMQPLLSEHGMRSVYRSSTSKNQRKSQRRARKR